MSERDIIIITYFFLLCPGEYTSSKSEITLFCLKDTAFRLGRRVFVATSTAGNIQDANFFTLAFMT